MKGMIPRTSKKKVARPGSFGKKPVPMGRPDSDASVMGNTAPPRGKKAAPAGPPAGGGMAPPFGGGAPPAPPFGRKKKKGL